jgi:hypothetical protein
VNSFTRVIGRLLLALAFVAGSWEDILPGIEQVVYEDAPSSASFPVRSIPAAPSGDDAGDGFAWGFAPLEQVLISEVDPAVLIHLQSHRFNNLAEQAPCSVAVRRISHVPKEPCLHA